MASITYKIDDGKFNKFKKPFLIAQPVPRDTDDNPVMSENEWIKEWGLTQFKNAYRRGVAMLVERDVVIDESIIE